MSVSVVVLAAGKGTRMKSDLPKVLHKVLGKSLLAHSLDALSFVDNQYVVVGHESDMVVNSLPSTTKHILQKDQLGTGHAVSTVISSDLFIENKSELTLVVPGDVPAIDTKGDGVIGNTLGFGPNVEGSSPSPPASIL